jgi:enoyl-CoA hydratase
MSRIDAFPKPVIAAVNGIATAGGIELVLACDVVIAAEGARIGDGHANFGLLPGAGGSIRLPRRIGAANAKYLFFTGDLLPAADPILAGLVTRIVPNDALANAVTALVDKLATKSPIGLARMKELANAAFDLSLAEGIMREQEVNVSYMLTFDRNEGLAAFNEKRRPAFQGR